jgi:cyclic pyranopterin phosphate synthase
MPEENYEFTPASRLMQPDEIESIAKIFVSQGVNKIRLTGGEPLVRKDAAEIILRLSKLPVSLTITTNGTRLHEFADILENAGVRSLNISLDTLNKEKFNLMTRRDQFERVYENIQLMIRRGFRVKVNMVVIKNLNHDEITDFIHWTRNEPVHVRFIEFMPFTGNRWESEKVFTCNEILEKAGTEFDILPLEFIIPGHMGTFAIISTMSAPFCSDCNRMRLTADGKMKNCLFSQTETDLLTPFRNNEDILPLIYQSISDKKEALGGQFTTDLKNIHTDQIHNRSMITIGG